MVYIRVMKMLRLVESCYKRWLLLIFCPKLIFFPRSKNCHLFVCLPVFLILITHSTPNFAGSLKLLARCSESSGFLVVCVFLKASFMAVWPTPVWTDCPLFQVHRCDFEMITHSLLSWYSRGLSCFLDPMSSFMGNPSFWWSTSSGAELWEVNCLKQTMSKNILIFSPDW